MARTLTASDRKRLIKMASTLPAGSEERRAILAAFAHSGTAPENQAEDLRRELDKRVRGAGKVIHIQMADVMTGDGSWRAVLDTEYAALKAYYVYRRSPGVRFGESRNLGGWYIAVD